jgi:hypothetical protein
MIPAGTKVYFAVAPADLRKSFDGLSALALGELQKSPSEGGLFVFLNKRVATGLIGAHRHRRSGDPGPAENST